MSCEEVLSLNDLSSSSVIYPGQMITVSQASSPAPAEKHHKVSSGETISTIAERYGVSTREVLKLNGLGSKDRIYPGQTIEIPTL